MRRATFWFIFGTVLLDMLALGVIAPVFPRLVVELKGGNEASAAALYGWFGTVWAAMQFLFAPVLGALSDRVGRRPVILVSCLGLGLDYGVIRVVRRLSLRVDAAHRRAGAGGRGRGVHDRAGWARGPRGAARARRYGGDGPQRLISSSTTLRSAAGMPRSNLSESISVASPQVLQRVIRNPPWSSRSGSKGWSAEGGCSLLQALVIAAGAGARR
jgi:hypothetical protein